MKYCDLIATMIHNAIQSDGFPYIKIRKPKYDLDKNGVFLSTKKTLTATDWNGQKYRITVEEE